MTITANSMIEDVAKYLSDYDEDESYVHWSPQDLLSYFKKAVGIIASVKRDNFTKRTIIKLKPGAVQDVPETCESDVTVYGLANDDGVVERLARRTKLWTYPSIGRPVCRGKTSGDGYVMQSYDYDADNPRQILVEPPVPEGVNVDLVISCYIPPTITGENSEVALSEDLEAAVFELMLYYAWGVDIEDTATRERSQQHWNNAMSLLQLSQTAQATARRIR